MKIVIFTPVKNRCMLHGRVFTMNFTVIMKIANVELAKGKENNVKPNNFIIITCRKDSLFMYDMFVYKQIKFLYFETRNMYELMTEKILVYIY